MVLKWIQNPHVEVPSKCPVSPMQCLNRVKSKLEKGNFVKVSQLGLGCLGLTLLRLTLEIVQDCSLKSKEIVYYILNSDSGRF